MNSALRARLRQGRVAAGARLHASLRARTPRSAPASPIRPDLRMPGLALAAWAAAWLGTWATPSAEAVIGIGVLSCAVAAVLRRSYRWVAVALVLAAVGGIGTAQAYRLSSGPLASLAHARAVVGATVQVRTDPQLHPASGIKPAYLTVQARMLEVTGRGATWRLRAPVLIVVTGNALPSWAGVPVGSHIRLQGRLDEADRGDDLAAFVRVRGAPNATRPPSAPLRLLNRVRDGLRVAVAERRDEQRALVPALVVGDTSRITAELTADFQATGLTHLTAVSGANLSLLLAFVLPVARWLGVRGWWLRLLGLAGVVVFVGLCRSEPSVLRAAAMGLVTLAALGSGGRRAGLRNLAVAVLVLLLIDPHLSRSLGFVLSVLASGGIIGWARGWALLLNRWLPLALAEAVAVPLSAHLTTLPVVASISGRVSVSGLVANAVAGPFVGPATVFGFAAAGASLVSAPLAAVLGFGAAWSAQMILWVAHAGAAMPGSSWHWPATPVALLWLGAAALLTGVVMRHILARPWLSLLLAAAMVTGLAKVPAQPGWPPRDWLLVACDVGQGDGLVLRAGPRAAVVIDTGPDPAAMLRCLDQLRVQAVPLLILTHFHADHVDGLSAVYAHRTVGQVWVTALNSPTMEAATVRRVAAAHRTPVGTPSPGVEVMVGEAALRVVGPVPHPTSEESESSIQNESSLVVMARVAGLRFLLTGDVEPPGQQAILATGADLHADVLKIPHHGSARQDAAFFAATNARVAIASAGVHNDYGHPAPATLQLARSLGMTPLATNQSGGIAVTGQQGTLGVVTQR